MQLQRAFSFWMYKMWQNSHWRRLLKTINSRRRVSNKTSRETTNTARRRRKEHFRIYLKCKKKYWSHARTHAPAISNYQLFNSKRCEHRISVTAKIQRDMPPVIIQIMCNNLFEHVHVIAIPDSVSTINGDQCWQATQFENFSGLCVTVGSFLMCWVHISRTFYFILHVYCH